MQPTRRSGPGLLFAFEILLPRGPNLAVPERVLIFQFAQVFQEFAINLRLKLFGESLVLADSLGVERSGLFEVSEVEMQMVESPVDLGQGVIDVPLLAAAKMSNSHVASSVGDLVRDSSVLLHWRFPLSFNIKSAAEKQEESEQQSEIRFIFDHVEPFCLGEIDEKVNR